MVYRTNNVFAYGSLRPGGYYWNSIRELVQDAYPAWLHGYQLYDLGLFPGILSDPWAPLPVQGYVLEPRKPMAHEFLDRVHKIEAGLYRAQEVTVYNASGRLNALVFVWNGSTAFHPAQKVESNLYRFDDLTGAVIVEPNSTDGGVRLNWEADEEWDLEEDLEEEEGLG